MSESTSETLTFLFTDLEGSTRLWEEHPDEMCDALAHHDRLVRDAVEGHDGQVVKSTGDGALATFRSAAQGVSAAVEAQSALCAAQWPERVELRVRMGLHTGEATPRDGDWFGSDVNRAARVMAVANGQQILCTGAVGEQVRERFDLVDLGEHRLRDLQSTVHLFQVDAPGLPAVFPPLRSLDAYRSNLPYELSSFVGRDEEVRTIADRVRGARVVSIVGVGGVGKTRLALQVGSEVLPHYPDGVWLCELAPVLDPDDLPDAVAAALGYTSPQGVPVAEGLARFLERKDLLLVLDNCEHLVGAVADWVSATTTAAPRVSVLTTSREALGVRGEHVSPLMSLEVPDGADATSVVTSEAGALFIARANEARGELILDETSTRAIRDLCARLDGIPLAIELAAAQTKLMTPTEILTRLDQQFRLLTGGRRTSLERHQTLRAAIDSSYDLLSDDERALLCRLSVCVGGFDLDAAVAMATGMGVADFDAFELLASLVAKSLVERSERDGTTRYRLLEMIRQYATEQLGATAAEGARDDHARHYLALATALFALTATPSEWEALDRLVAETPNLAAACRWLLEADRLPELATFFAEMVFLDPFAWPPTTLDEVGAIAGAAVDRIAVVDERGFENACYLAGCRAFFSGAIDEMRWYSELARDAAAGQPIAGAMCTMATVVLFDGDLEQALSLAHDAIDRARHDDDPAQLAWVLGYTGLFETINQSDRAVPLVDEALRVARSTGSTIASFYPLQAFMGATYQTDPARALAAAEESMGLDRTSRSTYLNQGRARASVIRLARGEIAEGLSVWQETLRSYADGGERSVFSISLSQLAEALATHDPRAAIELAALAESDAITAYATFANQPGLIQLAESCPSEVAAAVQRFEGFGYDDAVAFITATLDRLIAEHGSGAAQ